MEPIINAILNDPSFFKTGGSGTLVLSFMYFIYTRSEKNIKILVNEESKKTRQLIEVHLKSMQSMVKNIVHDELDSAKKAAHVEYRHLLKNIKLLPSLLGEIVAGDTKDVKENVKKGQCGN